MLFLGQVTRASFFECSGSSRNEFYEVEAMDTIILKIFITVVEEGSISKAALALNYAQSNLTARIKQLERDLGKPLLYRHSKGITPTAAGMVFYEYAKRLVGLYNETVKAVQNADSASGTIKIGAIEEIAIVKLPKILAFFSQGCPHVDVDMTLSTTQRLVEMVQKDEIDGAYVVGPIIDFSMKQQFIMEDELVLVSNRLEGDKIDIRSLANKRLLLTNPHCLYKERLNKWLKDEGIAVGKVMEFGSLEGLLTCVREGFGITVMAKSLFDDLQLGNEVSWLTLPKEYGKVEIVFIMKKDSPVSSKLEVFLGSHRF